MRPHPEESAENGHLPDPDTEVIRLARDGDEAACHALVDRFAPELYRLAYFLVGNAADAEDVLQETFSGAFRHLGRFAELSSVRTWLCAILVRQAARCRRRRKRQMISLEEGTGGASHGAVLVRDETSSADLRMDLEAALDTLPEDHREVIVLRELIGLSYEEIAQTLDLPRGTVESRLFRARRTLRERLKDYMPGIR